jgi:phosphomannomutase
VTISGVRGIAGDSLLPEVVGRYVAAFATLQAGKRVVLGRDSRVSGPWVTSIAHGVLMAHGYDVLDVGIVPTPTVRNTPLRRVSSVVCRLLRGRS